MTAIEPYLPAVKIAQVERRVETILATERPVEGRFKRGLFLLVAALCTAAFFVVANVFWTGVHTGVDQNGYLVGGKQFANNFSMKQTPMKIGTQEFDPHAFIANMWVTAPSDKGIGPKEPHRFYPKYPLGLPLIYAMCLWVGGSAGPTLAYYVSPVAMTATVLGVFFLVRHFAGSFSGLLAMLVFATSPTIAYLMNNPNSHAATLVCVVFGMLSVLHWHRRGGFRYAILGGWLVGYAATIRYSEAALVLPLIWAVFWRPDRVSVRTWLERSTLLLAWAMPIAMLLGYNYLEMGTLTGYDTTNESSAFSWVFFYDNWETLLRQMNLNGLFLIFPISLVGLVAMFWFDWPRALFLALWVGPCLTTYTFYYWGPDGVNYLRFVVTVLPPLLVAAFWWMTTLAGVDPQPRLRVPLYATIILLTPAGIGSAAAAYYGLRFNITTHKILPIEEYMDQWPGTFEQIGAHAAFIASVVVAGIIGAAIVAAVLVGRSLAPTISAGFIAFLSVAVQGQNSTASLERDSYETSVAGATAAAVKQIVPNGAVLISPDATALQYLQFVTDDLCYSGLSFDKGWVEGRPRGATEDPVLIDPVRNQELYNALAERGLDQKFLNAQARDLVQQAIRNKRQVFVMESMQLPPMLAATKKREIGPVPAFLTKYIIRPNDKSLVARRVTWWNIPQLPDAPRSTQRGRRNPRQGGRSNSTFQLWEITAG